jgi:hypothetical protein
VETAERSAVVRISEVIFVCCEACLSGEKWRWYAGVRAGAGFANAIPGSTFFSRFVLRVALWAFFERAFGVEMSGMGEMRVRGSGGGVGDLLLSRGWDLGAVVV